MNGLARRVHLMINYEGADITKDINKYMLSCSYTDNAADQADDLQIELEDKEGLWHGDWLPQKGDLIHASFIVENWSGKEDKKMLPLGSFTVDTFKIGGPPDTVQIAAQSIPLEKDIKKRLKTKAWEKINLSAISMDIASWSGLQCLLEIKEDPFYEHIDQVKESDIAFLANLCKRAGVSLKITDSQIVLFDEEEYESKETSLIVKKGVSNILNYSFESSINDTAYGSCRVRYTNPKTNKTIEYTYKPRKDNNGGACLEVNEQVKDRDEAAKLAKKRLREKNKVETKASISLMGDIRFIAGVTIQVVGFKAFDGKYIIQKASHNIIGGYTVDIEITKCLEGY